MFGYHFSGSGIRKSGRVFGYYPTSSHSTTQYYCCHTMTKQTLKICLTTVQSLLVMLMMMMFFSNSFWVKTNIPLPLLFVSRFYLGVVWSALVVAYWFCRLFDKISNSLSQTKKYILLHATHLLKNFPPVIWKKVVVCTK